MLAVLLLEDTSPCERLGRLVPPSISERPLDLGDLPVIGDAEDLEPVALPWRGGRIGEREPELIPDFLLRGLSTTSAPEDSAALVSTWLAAKA